MMPRTHCYTDLYLKYVQAHCFNLEPSTLFNLKTILDCTTWDEPESALDWHNVGVLALVEAEQCADDISARRFCLEYALEALNTAAELDSHPLCAAHLAIINTLINLNKGETASLAFNQIFNLLQPLYEASAVSSQRLIYLPAKFRLNDQLERVLGETNGYKQALMLLGEALWGSQLILYSPEGKRFLQIINQLFPDSASQNLKLGIYNLMSQAVEGLLYLYHAKQLAPDSSVVLQALYLGYSNLGNTDIANYWLNLARENHLNQNGDKPEWQWARLSLDSIQTYIPFEQNLVLAVEPSFKSIVTSVLLAEGDWFEDEMEFWRGWIKPGMTVIDVGANVGVYTFSAAQRVGKEGLVLAIEPFSKCVSSLEETCHINQLDWVRICAGAASDHNGTVKLGLSSASEVNEIIDSEVVLDEAGNQAFTRAYEVANCFTLDSLVESEGVSSLDFLKIDAEGHEIQVLTGCDHILREFSPIILYENNSGSSRRINLPVANFLLEKEYKLFRYQPYVQRFIPLLTDQDLLDVLNVIAIPPHKLTSIQD
jgi:FkbM family methyltransferase